MWGIIRHGGARSCRPTDGDEQGHPRSFVAQQARRHPGKEPLLRGREGLQLLRRLPARPPPPAPSLTAARSSAWPSLAPPAHVTGTSVRVDGKRVSRDRGRAALMRHPPRHGPHRVLGCGLRWSARPPLRPAGGGGSSGPAERQDPRAISAKPLRPLAGGAGSRAAARRGSPAGPQPAAGSGWTPGPKAAHPRSPCRRPRASPPTG